MFEKSQQETKNWVSKAIDVYKASGKDITFAEFTNPKGPFVQNEMYIFGSFSFQVGSPTLL